jgi:hypothetical protein
MYKTALPGLVWVKLLDREAKMPVFKGFSGLGLTEKSGMIAGWPAALGKISPTLLCRSSPHGLQGCAQDSGSF